MEEWQRRVERAEALARRFPFSAELMYFYRDMIRFRGMAHGQDPTPLRALAGNLGAFYARLFDSEAVADAYCRHPPDRIHTDPEFPHIRVEACGKCRIYRKVVDLELDPGAIFEVDDLASVPLDLWAVANGYRRPVPNLFGF